MASIWEEVLETLYYNEVVRKKEGNECLTRLWLSILKGRGINNAMKTNKEHGKEECRQLSACWWDWRASWTEAGAFGGYGEGYKHGSGKHPMPLCPPEKEEAIKDNFEYFELIWRLAALFGGRFFNTLFSEQYIHVGKYLFCMCNSPTLWISKCICHGHPWHWFHSWYLLECSWQSEVYLLHHLLQGSMFLCLLPHDEHQQQTDYCPLRWNNSRHVFRGLRHLITDIQWLQSFFLVPFLSRFLNNDFVQYIAMTI